MLTNTLNLSTLLDTFMHYVPVYFIYHLFSHGIRAYQFLKPKKASLSSVFLFNLLKTSWVHLFVQWSIALQDGELKNYDNSSGSQGT